MNAVSTLYLFSSLYPITVPNILGALSVCSNAKAIAGIAIETVRDDIFVSGSSSPRRIEDVRHDRIRQTHTLPVQHSQELWGR